MLSNQLGIRLRAAVEYSEITLAELAARVGYDKSTISRYLAGLLVPRIYLVRILASELGVDPDWLLGVEGAVAVPGDGYASEYIEQLEQTALMREEHNRRR